MADSWAEARAEATPAAGEVGYIEDGLLERALMPLMRTIPPLWEYLVAHGWTLAIYALAIAAALWVTAHVCEWRAGVWHKPNARQLAVIVLIPVLAGAAWVSVPTIAHVVALVHAENVCESAGSKTGATLGAERMSACVAALASDDCIEALAARSRDEAAPTLAACNERLRGAGLLLPRE